MAIGCTVGARGGGGTIVFNSNLNTDRRRVREFAPCLIARARPSQLSVSLSGLRLMTMMLGLAGGASVLRFGFSYCARPRKLEFSPVAFVGSLDFLVTSILNFDLEGGCCSF